MTSCETIAEHDYSGIVSMIVQLECKCGQWLIDYWSIERSDNKTRPNVFLTDLRVWDEAMLKSEHQRLMDDIAKRMEIVELIVAVQGSRKINLHPEEKA